MSQESLDQLVKELASVLPPEALLRSSEACRPYECDGLTGYRALPAVVALPDSFAQVQSILKLCERYRVPLVARGAGTGLSGGATPHPEGVLLSMARFNRIIAIDPAARTARVQPGVRKLLISQAGNEFDL